jgi:hypothetical protein
VSMTTNKNAGKIVNCGRCGVRCRIADQRNENARIAAYAAKSGVCGNCAVTGILKTIMGEGDKHRAGWFSAFTVEGLRLPHVQERVIALLKAGNADLRPDEIDWDEVIANWNLPVERGAGGLWL